MRWRHPALPSTKQVATSHNSYKRSYREKQYKKQEKVRSLGRKIAIYVQSMQFTHIVYFSIRLMS